MKKRRVLLIWLRVYQGSELFLLFFNMFQLAINIVEFSLLSVIKH